MSVKCKFYEKWTAIGSPTSEGVWHLKTKSSSLKITKLNKIFCSCSWNFFINFIFFVFEKFWVGIYLDFLFEHRRRPDWNEIQLSTRSKMFQLREVFIGQPMRRHFVSELLFCSESAFWKPPWFVKWLSQAFKLALK